MEENRGFAGKGKNGASSIPAEAAVSSHASRGRTCAERDKGRFAARVEISVDFRMR
jgi:hypothetical protein